MLKTAPKIPDPIYKMVDEYSAIATDPVTEGERNGLLMYFFALVQRLMTPETISLNERRLLATQNGVKPWRVEEIILYLKWGTSEDE